MMKKIVIYQIPVDKMGRILITLGEATEHYNKMKATLPKDSILISSPFIIKIEENIIKIIDNSKISRALLDSFCKSIKNLVEQDGYILKVIN